MPSTGKEFFDCHRGTTYQAFGILWDKMQYNIGSINHALDVIEDQLARNDLAALEAAANGQAAVQMATAAVDEASNLVNKHVSIADKKVAELMALKVVLQDVAHDTSEFLAALKVKLESGELNGKDGVDGKDGRDGEDGKTPVKGVDYFDGRDGANGKDGINGRNGRDGVDGKDAYEVWLEDGHEGSKDDFFRWMLAQGNFRTLINELIESIVANMNSRLEWVEQNAIFRGEIVGDEEDQPTPPIDDEPSATALAIEDLKRRMAAQESLNETQQEQIDRNKEVNDAQQEDLDDEATEEDIAAMFE